MYAVLCLEREEREMQQSEAQVSGFFRNFFFTLVVFYVLNLPTLEREETDIFLATMSSLLPELSQINRAKKQLETGKQETVGAGSERSWFQTREERKKEKRKS